MKWDGLQAPWNRRPTAFLRKQGMFMLEEFQGHLKLDVTSVILEVNTDTVAIPEWITTKTLSSEYAI
jgi:hypothetical protein